MPEVVNTDNSWEQEVADLSRKIEALRDQHEKERGVEFDDRAREMIASHVSEKMESVPSDPSGVMPHQEPRLKDYFDSLDETVKSRVFSYVTLAEKKGIRAAYVKVKDEDPLVVDAFHDLLVDRLYQEFVKKGIIKE